MKVTQDDLLQFTEILDNAELFRPIIKKALDTIESFGPEMSRLPEKFREWVVVQNSRMFNDYLDQGFTRDEAMQLLLNVNAHVAQYVKNLDKNRK